MSSGINKKKLTLREFVWYGFNFTTAITFVGGLAVTSNSWLGTGALKKHNTNLIGINAIWVFLLIGVVAGLCAWCFSKMARVHHSDNNGGSYIFVRTTLGRYSGFLIIILLYITLPFMITFQILFLIQGSLNPTYIGDSAIISAHWGPFNNLWLDLIGVFIYMGASTMIFFGIKWYKKASNYTSLIKWITGGALLLAAIYMAVTHGADNVKYWGKSGNSPLTFKGFIYAFTTFFFYFTGFEIFSTAGRNIENPERNIGLGILLIMGICTVFYVVISLIFFLGFGDGFNGEPFAQNMAMGAWGKLNAAKWVEIAGGVIMLFSSLVMKIQIAVMNTLYGGTLLQPMAKEGYIPDSMRKLDKDNLPVKAMKWHLGITVIVILFWLIIPDIITGTLTALSDPAIHNHDITSVTIPGYNIGTFTAFQSIITIFIYINVVGITLWLGYKKHLRVKLWEYIVLPIVFLLLWVVFVYHYYALIQSMLPDPQHPNNWIAGMLELVFTGIVILIANLIYFLYYRPKYFKRLQSNPEIQETLNKKFQVIDDWAYVSLELDRELSHYLTRNQKLHCNKTNTNYEYAETIHKELQVVIGKFNAEFEERKKHDEDHIDE